MIQKTNNYRYSSRDAITHEIFLKIPPAFSIIVTDLKEPTPLSVFIKNSIAPSTLHISS